MKTGSGLVKPRGGERQVAEPVEGIARNRLASSPVAPSPDVARAAAESRAVSKCFLAVSVRPAKDCQLSHAFPRRDVRQGDVGRAEGSPAIRSSRSHRGVGEARGGC